MLQDESQLFDLIVRRATLVDGTGAPARVADVAVLNGVIAAVGDASADGVLAGTAKREIDAHGLLLLSLIHI